MLTATVTGDPVPKPDPRCFGRGGRHRLSIPAGAPGYRQWRARCLEAGRALAGRVRFPAGTGVAVSVTVTVARPASHMGTGRNRGRVRPSAPAWPTTRSSGDIDKITRLILDALTDAGVWDDDSQVVSLQVCKTFPGGCGMDRPGASIGVEAVA